MWLIFDRQLHTKNICPDQCKCSKGIFSASSSLELCEDTVAGEIKAAEEITFWKAAGYSWLDTACHGHLGQKQNFR